MIQIQSKTTNPLRYINQPRPQALARVAGEPGTFLFSRDRLHMGRDRMKDGCTSLPFAGDSVAALSLWYKQALKTSYKKYRFAALLCCLRTAAVLAQTKIQASTTLHVTYARKCTRPTAMLK